MSSSDSFLLGTGSKYLHKHTFETMLTGEKRERWQCELNEVESVWSLSSSTHAAVMALRLGSGTQHSGDVRGQLSD